MGDATGRALILAAGRGRRLGQLGAARPKCLIPLAGRPLLDWQLAALRTAGIDDIALVGGYRRRQLRRPAVPLFENAAWARTNMVASLRAGAAWLRTATTVVAYGDIVYHPRIIVALLDCDADVAISYDVLWRTLWDARFDRPELDAESLRVTDSHVAEIGGHGEDLERIEGQYMGLLRITPRGFRAIERHLAQTAADEVARMDMTTLLAQLVAAGVPVAAVPIHGCWCEVDQPSDLALYERMVADGTGWTHDWRS